MYSPPAEYETICTGTFSACTTASLAGFWDWAREQDGTETPFDTESVSFSLDHSLIYQPYGGH